MTTYGGFAAPRRAIGLVPDEREELLGPATARQEAHLVELHLSGQYTSAELAELFSVARSTVYRAIERAKGDVGEAS